MVIVSLGIYLLMSIHLPLISSLNQAPIIETRSGKVEGATFFIRETTIERFHGIPFASPPVGSLRWHSPVQEKQWTGLRPAKRYSDACMQKPNAFTKLPPVPVSEDCLYLNVYRPDSEVISHLGEKKLPILLFFYGGSYEEGASSFLIYDASERVAISNGSVIIVTANYRLNVFGYLGGDALRDTSTGGDNSTGNWGLQDQRAAMKWVRDNADAFGGDPERVTIYGESAGSGSVSCHIAAKKSAGYFHRAIMESGPLTAAWVSHNNVSEAEEVYVKIQKVLNCSDTKCMRSKSAEDVFAASRKANGIELSWAPLIDGVEFTDDLHTLVRQGKFNKVPIILGTNRDEGSTFTDKSLTEAEYEKELRDTFGVENASKVLNHYPVSNYQSPFWAMSAVQGDAAMTCPARETARILSEGGVDVYLYFFTRELEFVKLFLEKPLELGVFHGSELPFVFDKEIALITLGERKLAGHFGSFWNAFAATGDPNSGHDVPVQWPVYTQVTDKSIRLDVDITVNNGLKKELCDFWTTVPVSSNIFNRRFTSFGKILNDIVQKKN